MEKARFMKLQVLVLIVFLGMMALLASHAIALFNVPFALRDQFKSAGEVSAGKVSVVDVEKRIVVVEVTETFKGETAGKTFRVVIEKPAEIMSKIAVQQPVVIFVSKKGGRQNLVNIADTWLLAQPVEKSNPPAYRATGEFAGKKCFPGRTIAVVRIASEIKAADGKSPLVDSYDEKVFTGGVKELTKVKLTKPTFLLAANVTGGKTSDLVVGAADGAHVASSDKGFSTLQDAMTGGTITAVGDVNGDGKPDLLVGKTLYLNDGGKFKPSTAKIDLPAETDLVAVTIADVTGDKKADVVALKTNGELLVFENPVAPDKPWIVKPAKPLWKDEKNPVLSAVMGDFGDDGLLHIVVLRESGITRYGISDEPAADFVRLTGDNFEIYNAAKPNWLAGGKLVSIDSNGDGKPDLLIISPTASLLLVNRGFGAYFANPDAGKELKGPAFPITAGTRLAGADLRGDKVEDLLILTEDGTLYGAANPPSKAPVEAK